MQVRVLVLLNHCSIFSVLKPSLIARHSFNRAFNKGVSYVNVQADVNAFMVGINLHANERT